MTFTYLDHSASSPMRKEVYEVYKDTIEKLVVTAGNPSSLHKGGLHSRELLESAREKISTVFGVKPAEIIFTSGGTESDNLAVVSVARKVKEKTGKNIVVISAIEHPAVGEVGKVLSADGIEVVKIPVTVDGVVDLDFFTTFVAENLHNISVISVMLVNNETGVVQPVDRIVEIIRGLEESVVADSNKVYERIYVHTDAVQGFGHVDFSFQSLGVDALSISGHKIGAPVGVGVLVAKQDLPLGMVYAGGGQERGVRSGTIDVAGACAISVACELALADFGVQDEKFAFFKERIIAALPEGVRVSSTAVSSNHIVHLVCEYGGADALLFTLDSVGVAVSAGSACRAGVAQSSFVLEAMGFDGVRSSGGLRVSFGHSTVLADVDRFIEFLPKAVDAARALSSVRFS